MNLQVSQPTQPGVNDPQLWLRPEDLPNIDKLVTEDDTPVDGFVSEKHMRLLVDSLYSSWSGPGADRPFVAMANVGLFSSSHEPAIVPDVLVSLDVRLHPEWRRREYRSYFVWVFGKFPDLVLEIVSNREGGEDSSKLREYARLGIPYYVIFDPNHYLGQAELRAYRLRGRTYEAVDANWLPEVGLGLTLWEGTFENAEGRWLRWCDQQGRILRTGKEAADEERQRADAARQQTDQERQRAEQERQRADAAQQQGEQERQRADRLAEQLRQLGVDPHS